MTSPAKQPRGRGLTRESVVRAALAIVDREGLDALSMRKLGAELGVDPMAAYRHLPNKEALLDGVVEAVVSEVDLDVDRTLSWQDQVRQLVDADMRTMLAHPNVLPLIAQRPLTTPRSLMIVERALEIMDSAGIPRLDSILAINVMGFLITAQAVAMTAPVTDPRGAGDVAELIARLPRAEFPLIVDAVETGQFIRSYDQLLEFWIGAMLARLERTASGPKQADD